MGGAGPGRSFRDRREPIHGGCRKNILFLRLPKRATRTGTAPWVKVSGAGLMRSKGNLGLAGVGALRRPARRMKQGRGMLEHDEGHI